MPEKCSECGLIYASNLDEDAAHHEEYHADFLSNDYPEPDQLIANLVDLPSGLITFSRRDSDYLHEKLYKISRRFAFEMGERTAWAEHGRHLQPGSIGCLFSDNAGRVLGGGGVYEDLERKDVACLIGWLWVVPSYRRQGVISRALPALVRRYPGAVLNPPYSGGMERLAEKSPCICKRSDGLLHLSYG